MDRIAVLGIAWQQRRPDLLARFTIAREDRAARLPALARTLGTPELVYLATCNRVEVALVTDGRTSLPERRRRLFAALAGEPPKPGEAEQALRAWHGEGAVEHLFLVASGLDSARVGESEIAGQVRESLELSHRLGLVGPELDESFTASLKVSRQVRPLTEGRIGKVSLADVALRRVRARLARTPGPVALIGVGPMTEQCARGLTAAGASLIIVNRTRERAERLGAELKARARSLDEFRLSPDAVEAVIVATGAKEPVLTRPHLERLAARAPSGSAPLVVDFAVPPNVTPEDAAAADVPRIGMDEITEDAALDRERVLLEFTDARALVNQALDDVRRQSAERLAGPRIAELRRRFRSTAIEGVERLLSRDLPSLSDAERDAVYRWAETLAGRLAHLPSVGLRQLAVRAGPAALEAFFENQEPAAPPVEPTPVPAERA